MDFIENAINEVAFKFRDQFWGHWKLRSGTPKLENYPEQKKLYENILASAFSVSDFSLVREKTTTVFDIGCQHWFYVGELSQFFFNASLVGIELDGGRRYWNFFRRIDLARAYADEAGRIDHSRRVDCLHADFLSLDFNRFEATQGQTVFCFFFPFVSRRPCLKWGLPARYSNFKAHLERTLSTRAKNTYIVSAHQGEWEAELARESYEALGFLNFKEAILPKARLFDIHIISTKIR